MSLLVSLLAISGTMDLSYSENQDNQVDFLAKGPLIWARDILHPSPLFSTKKCSIVAWVSIDASTN